MTDDDEKAARARPEVVAAARRIKLATLALADRDAGIDTSKRRPLVASLPALQAQLAVREDLSMRVVADILDEVVPMLELLARVREIIDATVAHRTAMAAIDGWADIRDALYPDTDEARITREARARRAAGAESWATARDIPDGPATCDECGSALAEVVGRGMGGGEVRGVICMRCASTAGTGTAHLDDDELG